MNIRNMIKRKALIIPAIIAFSLVFVYLSLYFLFFNEDPFFTLLGRVTDDWLRLHEGMANRYLQWTDTGAVVKHHLIFREGASFDTIRSGTLMRKWIVLLLGMAWGLPSSLRSKLLFSAAVLLLNFFMTPVTIAVQAYLSTQGLPYKDIQDPGTHHEYDPALFLVRQTQGGLLEIPFTSADRC